MQGHSVTITDEKEHEFVVELLPDNTTPILGLSDIETKGELKWVTGEPFNYTMVHPHDSLNNSDDSDNTYLQRSGYWFHNNDQYMSNHHHLCIMVEFYP